MYSKTMKLFLALGLAATVGACGGGDQSTPDAGDSTEPTQEQTTPDGGEDGGEGGEG